MKYRHGRNFCDCHPETCCCPPWCVYSPDGEPLTVHWELIDAKTRATQLNKQVKLKKQADQAMVWTDVNKLHKLIKALTKQLQV